MFHTDEPAEIVYAKTLRAPPTAASVAAGGKGRYAKPGSYETYYFEKPVRGLVPPSSRRQERTEEGAGTYATRILAALTALFSQDWFDFDTGRSSAK